MTGEELRQLRLAKNLSLRELSRRAGISVATLSSFENGHHPTLRPLTLRRLRTFLGTDADLPNIRMDPETAAKAAAAIEPAVIRRRIPVIGMAAAMEWEPAVQQVFELWENSDETISCAIDREGLAAIRINGSSMEPSFSDGDIVAVEPETLPATGDVALICLRGEGLVIKRWYWRHGKVRLESLNAAGRNFEWSIDEVREKGLIQWRCKVVATLLHKW